MDRATIATSPLVALHSLAHMHKNLSKVTAPAETYIASTSPQGSHWVALRIEKQYDTTYAILVDSLGLNRIDLLKEKLESHP